MCIVHTHKHKYTQRRFWVQTHRWGDCCSLSPGSVFEAASLKKFELFLKIVKICYLCCRGEENLGRGLLLLLLVLLLLVLLLLLEEGGRPQTLLLLLRTECGLRISCAASVALALQRNSSFYEWLAEKWPKKVEEKNVDIMKMASASPLKMCGFRRSPHRTCVPLKEGRINIFNSQMIKNSADG